MDAGVAGAKPAVTFKVGDRVRIAVKHWPDDRRVGTVVTIGGNRLWPILVRPDGHAGMTHFAASELERYTAPYPTTYDKTFTPEIADPKRYYVAGPMSGIADFNFPLFFQVADEMRAAGHLVENPADNDGDTLAVSLPAALQRSAPWAEYLKRDLARIFACDGVVLLPGWRNSRGARLEVHVATQLGMTLHRWDGGLQPLFRVIGLAGYARSGKDTAAGLLGWTPASFAAGLKQCLLALDPLVDSEQSRLSEIVDQIGMERTKDEYAEVRGLLQRMGTEVGRNILGANLWVDVAMSSLEDGGRYVFTDVRFPNEADAIKAAGGKVVRIVRPGFAPVNAHPSETALDDYEVDAVVLNDGSLAHLAQQIKRAAQ